MNQETREKEKTAGSKIETNLRNRDLLIRYMEEQSALGNFEKIDLNNLSSKQIESILDATDTINEFRELMMY